MESAPDSPATASQGQIQALPPWLGVTLRIAVTTVLVLILASSIDWREVGPRLRAADKRWWCAGVATTLVVQMVAGVRWASLARPLGFHFSRRFFVWRFFEGMFYSLFLPSSIGGDVIKAYRVGDSTQRRLLAGCSVLADRLTGLAALGVLAGAAGTAAACSLGTAATLAVGTLFLLVVVAAFFFGVGKLDRLLERIPARHPTRAFLSRLLPYQQKPWLIVRAVGWSFVVQMGGAAAVGLIARSLGVDLPLSLWFWVVPSLALVMVLPIFINGVGVREGGLAVLLAPYGVSTDQAVAVGVLWLATTMICGGLGGVLCLLDLLERRPGTDASVEP